MKKFSKIAAFIFALSLSVTVMTACGDSKDSKNTDSKSVEDIDEKDLEDALNKLDEETSKDLAKEKEEATEAETEPTTAAEIKYEATDEIKKAALNSGYIQIGDTVFRTGGYMTAAELVEMCDGKFDTSEIHLDEYLTSSSAVNIYSLDDPRIEIFVHFSEPKDYDGDRVKIPDAVVSKLEMRYFDNKQYGHGTDGGDFHYLEDVIFFPQGLKTMDYDDIKEFVAEQGLTETKSLFREPGEYNEDEDGIAVTLEGEENLMGEIPKIHYFFNFDPKTLKGTNLAIFVS